MDSNLDVAWAEDPTTGVGKIKTLHRSGSGWVKKLDTTYDYKTTVDKRSKKSELMPLHL